MKLRLLKNTIYLLLPVLIIMAMANCSEEIVPIYIQDRTALDSLEQEISTIGDDLSAVQIARDSLKRVSEDLDAQYKAILAQTADSVFADIHFTVQVTDGSLAYNNARVASLAGALVTISQGNVFQEVTTDGTGFATFPALDNGYISVTVEISGFSDVYMVVNLGASSGGDTRNVSTQVMVFPTSGSSLFTLTGTSYYDQDLDSLRTGDLDDPFHPVTGADIYEIVPTGTQFLIDCVPSSIPNNIPGKPGFVVAAVYAGLERVAASDASGDWSITLPSVLLTDGSNLFSYNGPFAGDQISGTRISTALGNSEEVWAPNRFEPVSLGNLLIFPGGNSNQDLYYEPL